RGLVRLKTVRAIGNGNLESTRANLQQAAAEVHAFPDYLAVLTALSWVLAVAGVAAGTFYFGEVDRGTVARICAIGLCFAPLSAALVNLGVMRRARVVTEAIA